MLHNRLPVLVLITKDAHTLVAPAHMPHTNPKPLGEECNRVSFKIQEMGLWTPGTKLMVLRCLTSQVGVQGLI